MATDLSALKASCSSVPRDCVANVAEWLGRTPPPPDYILDGVFETGSRVMLVGSSKTRKSFMAAQLAVCIATGQGFIGIRVPKPRRLLLANLENARDWQHRRFLAMCKKMGVTAEMLGDRLSVLNGRGKNFTLEDIEEEAVRHRADVIICDPLYKLDGGADESNMEERKHLISKLGEIGARTNAALVYVHHDAKGMAGDRDIRDRGAGSSIINRDVDATLALTLWGGENDSDKDNLIVLSVLSRNAPPRPDMTLVFDDGLFIHDADRTPVKATSSNRKFKKAATAIPDGNPSADAAILGKWANAGPAKSMTELRAHGEGSGWGDKRTRRALTELKNHPDKYVGAMALNLKTDQAFLGEARSVSMKLREKEIRLDDRWRGFGGLVNPELPSLQAPGQGTGLVVCPTPIGVTSPKPQPAEGFGGDGEENPTPEGGLG